MTATLQAPSLALLPSYLDALLEGKFVTMQPGFGNDSADIIKADPAAYIARVTNPAPFFYTLKNGKTCQVTEHELLWIANGDKFLGTIALRYRGDPELLDIYAGHIGMAVRPALFGRGYGPRAIRKLRADLEARAKAHGLPYIYATCDTDNLTSARLIEFFGGVLIAETSDVFGENPSRRYRIDLET